jgi:hypothetical protein
MVRFSLRVTNSFKIDDERKAIVMPVAALPSQPSLLGDGGMTRHQA